MTPPGRLAILIWTAMPGGGTMTEHEDEGKGFPAGAEPHAGEPEPGHGQDTWEKPVCPRCGWSNTRPSVTWGVLDTILQVFAIRPYRCRSCGVRFRAIRRPKKEE